MTVRLITSESALHDYMFARIGPGRIRGPVHAGAARRQAPPLYAWGNRARPNPSYFPRNPSTSLHFRHNSTLQPNLKQMPMHPLPTQTASKRPDHYVDIQDHAMYASLSAAVPALRMLTFELVSAT